MANHKVIYDNWQYFLVEGHLLNIYCYFEPIWTELIELKCYFLNSIKTDIAIILPKYLGLHYCHTKGHSVQLPIFLDRGMSHVHTVLI